MAEVRVGVDAIDAELVSLLATRFAYMRAAAPVKPELEMVRDEARKAAVIEAACQHARMHELPVEAIASLWEPLVESSIA